MSRFFSQKYASLTPYVPGEQPKERDYIKLNTNESPFAPAPDAVRMASEAAGEAMLYPDPEYTRLKELFAKTCGVSPDEVLPSNGSDEILNFAFTAFCDENTPAAFADITYGFYPVFADFNGVKYDTIPLKSDLTIAPEDYYGIHRTIFLANPNAPTGIALEPDKIESIIKANPDHVVVVDEAYIDFGAQSVAKLIHKYDNLLVTQTFSKSRSLAGARLGFGIACPELIRDLDTVKYSTNPYNVSRMTASAGVGALMDAEYTERNCRTIIKNREFTAEKLKKLGFFVTDSATNFVFAAHEKIGGGDLYRKLKERGILVRHFDIDRIRNFNRITIGSMEQMTALTDAIKEILEEL